MRVTRRPNCCVSRRSFGLPLVAIGGITRRQCAVVDRGRRRFHRCAFRGIRRAQIRPRPQRRVCEFGLTRAPTPTSILQMTSNHELVPARTAADARWRQFAGTRVQVRRRRAVLHRHADGAYLWDVEGKRYIDYVGSWGPMIVGHNHPACATAVERAAQRRACRSARRARPKCAWRRPSRRLVPSIEMVRMVNSGTEATMTRDPPRARLHRPRARS